MPAKGLRQFLSLEQQHSWLDGEASLIDSEDRSEFLEQRFNYAARFEKLLRRPQAEDVLDILSSMAGPAFPFRARPSAITGRSPACPRPPTSPSPGSTRAGWSSSRFCRTATTSAPGSSFTCPISPRTDHPSPTISITPFLTMRREPEDVSHFLWKADTFGAKVRGSLRSAIPRRSPRAPRYPPLQPHPHEPRPQRLSGEPLLLRRRLHGRRLSSPNRKRFYPHG